MVNIYNPLIGFERFGRFANIIINIPEVQQRWLLIIRNINLHYTNWDNCTIYSIIYTQRLIEWVTNNNGAHQLKLGVSAEAKRNRLDFVISSRLLLEQVTECYVELCFYITSNRKTIITRLELEKPASKDIGQQKIRLDKINEKQFVIRMKA